MPILVAGATGNTGRSVVAHLSSVSIPVIALTRDASSPAAQKLAALPGVTVEQQDWREVTADWLRARKISRVFIASHNGPSHFMDESIFLLNVRRAGIEYLVRISTTAPHVKPDSDVYYARAHWAIENLLSQPEFSGSTGGLKWTSLQPNIFSTQVAPAATAWLESYRKSDKKTTTTPLELLVSEHGPVAQIDPDEVGLIAGHLLALDDVSAHNGQRYVLAGPENITGAQIKALVEKHAGTTVDHVTYDNTEPVLEWLNSTGVPKSATARFAKALDGLDKGDVSVENNPTSKAVLDLYAPRRGAAEVIDELLAAVQ